MKISVIVPFYNVEEYISRCLYSIINQSYRNIEIILVDDGSTDRSSEIAKEYASKDDRIILISQKNSGQAAARNVGLRNATGDYISFVDSDDWLEVNMLERLIKIMELANSDIVQCRFQFDNDAIRQHTAYRLFDVAELKSKNDIITDALLVKNILVAPWAKLFKKSFLIDNNLFFEEGIVNEDTLFTLKLSCFANNISFSNDILYHAIERPGSTSRGSYKRLCSHMVIALNQAKEFYIKQGIFDQYESIFKARYIKSIQYNLLQAAQRLPFSQYKDIWKWNMQNSEYNEFNRHAFRKYLPIVNRVLLSIFDNCAAVYFIVRIANCFNIKMH